MGDTLRTKEKLQQRYAMHSKIPVPRKRYQRSRKEKNDGYHEKVPTSGIYEIKRNVLIAIITAREASLRSFIVLMSRAI
jgi:hypothetical protein